MRQGPSLSNLRPVAAMMAATALAFVLSGCSSGSLRETIAKGDGEWTGKHKADVARLPPLKVFAESPEIKAFARNHPTGRDCSFTLPSEEESPAIAPLGRDSLVGDWSAVYHAFERTLDSRGAKPQFSVVKAEERYSFRADGTYKMTLLAFGKTRTKSSGRWTYSNGMLDLTANTDANWRGEYRIDWFARDKMAIRCRTSEIGATMILNHLADKYPAAKFKSECKFWYDSTGCQRIVRDHIGKSHAVHADAIETPHLFRRTGSAAVDKSLAPKKPYSIISCVRESGSDFAYRFVLELSDAENAGLDTFRIVQQDFRKAISEDYSEAFSLESGDGLYVDFPQFELKDGKIEGRAVVLAIKITSLVYNAQTRSGVLAARVGANQFEEARQYIRRNIETLAMDKNIALVTGEVPAKAKFYLGREEIKDGDILEIEFKTE